MNKLLKFTGSGKPKRSRSKQHKQSRYKDVTKAAVSFMAPLLFVGALILPQTALSKDENVSNCSIERGTIDTVENQRNFNENASGQDFKVTCTGELQADLTNESIRMVLDSQRDKGYVHGESKFIIELKDITSQDKTVNFYTTAAPLVITGSLTNTVMGHHAVRLRSVESNPDNLDDGGPYDLNVESHAMITATGDGSRALYVYSDNGANVDLKNYGTVKSEGKEYLRPPGQMYRVRIPHAIATGSEKGDGDIHVTNAKGGTVSAIGDGARGIHTDNTGTGNTLVENFGSVTTYGDMWDTTSLVEDGWQARPDGVYAKTAGGDAKAINHEGGTITTHGAQARGISVNASGKAVAGNAAASNDGTITTYGDAAHGMSTWVDRAKDRSVAFSSTGTNSGMITAHGENADGMRIFGPASGHKDSVVSAVNTGTGTITTHGDSSEGVQAFSLLYSATDVDAMGTAKATNAGKVTVTGNDATGVSAGYWANPNPAWGPSGGKILNSGDSVVENTGTVIASGSPGYGLYTRTFGTGNSEIRATGGTVTAGSADTPKKFGVGIWGEANTDSGADDPTTDVDVYILVSGADTTISAFGAENDDVKTDDIDESKGIAIVAESGAATGHSHVLIKDGAKVSSTDYAVKFIGGRGTLDVFDANLVGSILFTNQDDVLNIENMGSIDGDIDFGGGNDMLNAMISEDQLFNLTGNVLGLETLTKTGKGTLRFEGDVAFPDSTLNLEDGMLIIAGHLNLGTGHLTIKQAAQLAFEIAHVSEHGSLSASTLAFEANDASVLAYIEREADADTVKAALEGQTLQFLNVDAVTSGGSSASQVMIKSATMNIGEIDTATGEGMISDADTLTTTSVANMGDSGSTGSGGTPAITPEDMPSASSGSSSSSGGAVLGIGLLAVLMSTFMADEDASASFGDYYFNTPQSAYIASINERGVMTIKETGNKPYQMWIRTGHTAQPMQMTGVSNTGVSGTEVGVNLYNSDTFYINTSVAPNVSAEVGSLNLAAKGEVYSLSSGWRNDRYFGGLRLSHGEFEVNSIVDNPIVNSALISNAKLRNTQAQLRAGMNLGTGALRFTPSASVQVGTYENSEHVAESPALEATIPSYAQDYTSVQLGLKMTSDKWLSFTNGSKWKPQLKFDSIHTDTKDAGSLTLRQSDKAGALSFNSNAGLRSMPDVVNSMSFGAKVKSSTNDQAEWKFGFAGLEADGEEYYAAMAAYQLKF